MAGSISSDEDVVRQRSFAENLVEESWDALLALTTDGKILSWNRGAETIFGFSRQEVLGRTLDDLIVPEPRRAEARAAFRQALDTGSALFETVRQRSDGSSVDMDVSMRSIRNERGEASFVTVAKKDITAVKRLRHERDLEAERQKSVQLEEQNHRMQEANRRKSEFLANMSHELRAPLNAILGFSQLMHDGKVGPVSTAHREYLGDILNSSRQLMQLINDVLDLAKVESGKIELRPEDIDVANLVGEVTDILRGLAEDKQIQIEAEVAADLGDVVLDPVRLEQVLYNYLSNAIKFSPERGRVKIVVGNEPGGMLRIEVQDSGIGIAFADQPRLFVEFQQLDAGTANRYAGTGLGLALTKRIVEAQGGAVGVESSTQKGSCFWATLPRRGPPQRRADMEASMSDQILMDLQTPGPV